MSKSFDGKAARTTDAAAAAVTSNAEAALEFDAAVSLVTGKAVEGTPRPYPCQMCRRGAASPGRSICAQCIEDMNTPALPLEDVQRCPTGIAEADCKNCFEDPEVLRLSRTGGWQDHCGYWQRNLRLDGYWDPEGIFEDSLRHMSAEDRRTARYLRRCVTRLGIDAWYLNDDVYDLLHGANGEPRKLRREQREALRQLGRTQGRLTRDDVTEALATPKSKS